MESSSFVLAKAIWFFALCLLTVEFKVVASDFINESHVAEYYIRRRSDHGDSFSVVFKQGCSDDNCYPSSVSQWCGKFSANADITQSRVYSCVCLFDYNTFLPDVGKCVNKSKALRHFNAGSVSQSLGAWEQLSLKTLKLGTSGGLAVPPRYKNCQVNSGGHEYYSFGLKFWENINQQIFSFKRESNRFEWKRDRTGELSGRIICLNVTCSLQSRHNRSGYLYFKASGNVTYCRFGSNFRYTSVCPTMSSSSLSSPSSSSQSFSELSSPFVVPTKTRQQTSSIQATLSTVYVASSRHPPSVPNGDISTSTAVNKQEASTQSASRSIFAPVVPPQKPSKSLVVSTSATLPPSGRDPGGGGGADARTDDGSNGAVIGAAAGGAVVFVALALILVVVFCKRRNQKRSKDDKTPPEVKNPVYGRTDNDIHMTTQTQRQAIASKGKDNQPVYQSLTHGDKDREAYGDLYVNPEKDYDNRPVYQSLERKSAEAGTPFYQSLQKGTTNPEYTYAQTQPSKANVSNGPKLNTADQQRKRSRGSSNPVGKTFEVSYDGGAVSSEEPMYNVLDGPDSVKESMGEPTGTQEPLYNELEPEPLNGSDNDAVREDLDAEQTYNAPKDRVDGTREPLYNVLEGEAPNGPRESLDPVYSVLDEPDRGTYEPITSETGQASAVRPAPQRGLQNPCYERTEDFEMPKSPQYASVKRQGPQKESMYQPLKRI